MICATCAKHLFSSQHVQCLVDMFANSFNWVPALNFSSTTFGFVFEEEEEEEEKEKEKEKEEEKAM